MLTIETITTDPIANTVAEMLAHYLGAKTNGTINVSEGMVDVTVSSKRNFARAIAGARRGCVGIIDDDWRDEETDVHYITATNGIIVSIERVYYW